MGGGGARDAFFCLCPFCHAVSLCVFLCPSPPPPPFFFPCSAGRASSPLFVQGPPLPDPARAQGASLAPQTKKKKKKKIHPPPPPFFPVPWTPPPHTHDSVGGERRGSLMQTKRKTKTFSPQRKAKRRRPSFFLSDAPFLLPNMHTTSVVASLISPTRVKMKRKGGRNAPKATHHTHQVDNCFRVLTSVFAHAASINAFTPS